MAPRDRKTMTYRQVGVDIDAGEEVVRRIRPLVERTRTPRVMGGLGGFAGLFRLDYNERLFQRNYRHPVLVACCDGVGSKMLVGLRAGRLDPLGIDCVAMNVNDLICCGAEPLLFIDYLGVHRVAPDAVAALVQGLSEGCVRAGCALLGGETAEMPDVYRAGEFDIAGFAVGVVERHRVIDGANARVGDVAIALASDGLHSNGYGLARRVLLGEGGFALDDRPPELEGRTVAEELLTPTRIYVQPVLEVLRQYMRKRVVRAMAHITGGGIGGNVPRVLPEGLTVAIKRGSWSVPPIFRLIAKAGPVDEIEMMRVFNMGVGFVLIVAPDFARSILNRLRRAGERAWVLGKVRKGGPDVQWA